MTEDKEQPAVEEDTGLDVDLGKVFDEVNKAEEPEEAPAKPEKEEKPEPKAEEPEVEETPPETKAEEPPVTEEPAEEPAVEEVAPPATWTAETKEMFSGLDPAIQQEVLKREKDFATGIQKNSEAAKSNEAYEQVIAPYKAMIAAEGGTPQRAVADLLNTAYQLRTGTPEQKAQLILSLANQFGADLSQTSPQEETDEYTDPDIQKLNQRLDTLQQTTQSQIQANQNQQIQSMQQQINDFRTETNEDGTLKHEHFEKVAPHMSALLTNNLVKDMEQAYNESLKLVPELHETMVQQKVKESEAARVAKETDAAEKAKKAQGLQLKDEATDIVTPKDGTMEDDLGAAYDAAEAKAS